MRRGMAALPNQGCAEEPIGRQRQASRYDQAQQRNAPGHLREAPALLLQRRHETRSDQVPKRLELRRPLARRRTQRQAGPLSRTTAVIRMPTTRSWASSDSQDLSPPPPGSDETTVGLPSAQDRSFRGGVTWLTQ